MRTLLYILLTASLLPVIIGTSAFAQQETNEFYSKFSEKEVLALYRDIHAALPEQSKETMALLIALMEKGELPVFFPRQNTVASRNSHYSRPLQINPFSIRTIEPDQANTDIICKNSNIVWNNLEKKEWVGDCIKTHVCPSGDITGIIIGDARNNTIECRDGNRLYWMGDGNNKIKSSYGNDIIETGSGNDVIETGHGSDIVIFRKNWGKDIIKSKCVFSSLNPDTLPAGNEKEIWLKKGYTNSNFVIFGPGIFPKDLQWQPEQDLLVKLLKNIKTGDQISFQPSTCFNFVFYEGGTIESHYNYAQRIQREAKVKETERIQALNLPEKYKVRLQNCSKNQEYKCYTQIADEVHKHITKFGQQCAIVASIGKAHADHGDINLARAALSFIAQNVSANTVAAKNSQNIGSIKRCGWAELNAFIISLAKAGEIELARKAHNYSHGNTVTKTLITEEILKAFIQQNRPQDALRYAVDYLYDNNASRGDAVEYTVTSQNFYSLLASLDYEAFIKKRITRSIDNDAKEAARIMRLLFIVAFDENNYQHYDEFLPPNLSPENLAAFYFSTGHQMFLNDRGVAGEYFYNKAIQAVRDIEDDKKRQQLTSTYFYFSFGFLSDNALAEKLAEFFSADTAVYTAASILAAGINEIKKGNMDEAKRLHKKAGELLTVLLKQSPKQSSISSSYNSPIASLFNTENITRWHETLTKEMTVKMLDTSPQETALQFYQNSSKTNNLLTTAKYQDLLARLLLKREHPEQALQTALLIADIDIRRGVLWGIANHASTKGNHTLNLKTINELMPTIEQSPEKVKQRILQKPEVSANKNTRNYLLSKRLVTLTEKTRHDSLYQKIITIQIENGDIDEAEKTITLLKDHEEIKKSREKINAALEKEARKNDLLSYAENKEALKKISELRSTDRVQAEQLIYTIKDPYYFAQAVLLLAE